MSISAAQGTSLVRCAPSAQRRCEGHRLVRRATSANHSTIIGQISFSRSARQWRPLQGNHSNVAATRATEEQRQWRPLQGNHSNVAATLSTIWTVTSRYLNNGVQIIEQLQSRCQTSKLTVRGWRLAQKVPREPTQASFGTNWHTFGHHFGTIWAQKTPQKRDLGHLRDQSSALSNRPVDSARLEAI